MFTSKAKVAAVGAFLAGGVLVGGVTLAMGVAHGASTTGTALTTSTGQSDAQYTAKHAWAQSVPVTAGTTTTPLSVPSGERITITSAISSFGGNVSTFCTIDAMVNGASVSYSLNAATDGFLNNPIETPFQSIYADSGSLSCGGGGGGDVVTLVGYLTPIPAG